MDKSVYPKRAMIAVVTLGTALVLSACAGPGPNNSEPAPTVTITVAAPEPGPEPSPTATSSATTAPSPSPTATTPPPTASASPSPSVTETPTQTPTETATPTPTVTTPATPVVVVTSQQCISSKLTVRLTANYDNSHQKGIQKIVVERPNEYNSWISANASWLGLYTGQGNQWTVQPAGSKTQRFKDLLRITVTATGGATTVIETTVSAPC